MKSLCNLLLVLPIFLSACGAPAAPLWGVAQTPTPAYAASVELPPSSGGGDVAAFPTSTIDALALTAAAYTPTSTPDGARPPVIPTLTPSYDAPPFLYYAQSGDMLSAVAARFGVSESEITSDADLTRTTLIEPGALLIIPNRIQEETTPSAQIIPDAEIIFSYTSANFDTRQYVKEQGGYLSTFRDYLGSTGWIRGDDAVTRLAIENSINPRLILALLEFESRWVRGQPIDEFHQSYPMGFNDYHYKGMSIQLTWAINNLSIGYYSWRAGTLTYLDFPDGSRLRLDPRLNAGTVALQYLFSRLHNRGEWEQIINSNNGFPAMYFDMFGDPWARADAVNPIFPPALNQPELVLPFEPGYQWSYTGGPHNAWGQLNPDVYGDKNSVYAAIDLSPSAAHSGCEIAEAWVVSAAPGLVVRSENGAVVVDLDGDGYEQTGWNLLYMHISAEDRVPAGTWLETNDRIGHPSCEGGVSTGTHLHFARKYNGEWVTADGPIPFIIGGWRVLAGAKAYEGKMAKDGQEITADPVGQKWSNITREE
ncbi:MAG: hypothetical protein Fur002_01390 [Anaerolineales bacterium]